MNAIVVRAHGMGTLGMLHSVETLDKIENRLRPSHVAVMVIDMQNDFCAEKGYVERVVGRDASPCRAVVPSIMNLVSAARQARVPVYWIKANYDPEGLPEGMLTKFQSRSREVCCGTGSWGSSFFEVELGATEPVITKKSFSAFANTEAEKLLRERGVRTVVFAGVQTNVCVESSLRDAVCRGFHVVLASDCVASHATHLHEATLQNVGMVFGDVVPSDAIVRAWGV